MFPVCLERLQWIKVASVDSTQTMGFFYLYSRKKKHHVNAYTLLYGNEIVNACEVLKPYVSIHMGTKVHIASYSERKSVTYTADRL